MTSVEVLHGPGVRLRPFAEADVDDLTAACADPAIHRFLPHLPHPYARDDAVAWVRTGAPAAWASGGAAYAVADPVTDRVLGGAGLGVVVPGRGQAEIGYWVAPWARRRRVASAATATLSAWAFARGLARLELLTHLENEASQRVAIAAGYRREGVRRAAGVRPDGSREDLVAWARLAGDPPGPSRRLLPDLPGGALADGVIRLRPLCAGDEDFLFALHTLPDVVASSVPPIAPDRAEVRLRCGRAAARWLAGERADLVVIDAASGAPVGEIGLYYQEPVARQAMIGYSALPAWRGRGYITRAVRAVARWGFAHVGLARLIAGTTPDNVGSQRVLERVGFRREGYQRARLPGPAGSRVDDLLYALLPVDVAAPGSAPAGGSPAGGASPVHTARQSRP